MMRSRRSRAGGTEAAAPRRAQALQRKAAAAKVAHVPANHVQADGALERQADEAAERAIRGERNVGRILTPATTGSVDLPRSRCDSLPEPVRIEAENAFGAELSAIRIHHDPLAGAAARGEGAQAFTAGRDVYFAEGKWDPRGDAGKRLLYHEVAHVLQQTGRRQSPTLVQATDQTGGGGIQIGRDSSSDSTNEGGGR
jgi:hypothetical protein